MRTNIDALNIVWSVLNGSPLKSAIDGKIYKSSRPLNSDKEDVVINALPISPGIPQRCIVNVNIYTRNLSLNIGGQPDNTMPDIVRMNTLAGLAIAALDEVSGDQYYFFVEQQATIKEPELFQHYINIRTEFFFTH
jgi:hypothetical protein